MNNDQSKNISNNDNDNSNKTQSNVKHKYLVEIVGTFILVYAIASAATVYSDSGQLGVIGIGLVHALVLTAIIYAIGYRSGAQVNPAVTIGLLVARKIGGKEAALYIICQIVGAVIGAAVVYLMFGSAMSTSVTLPSENNVMRAFVLETVMTFTLQWGPRSSNPQPTDIHLSSRRVGLEFLKGWVSSLSL